MDKLRAFSVVSALLIATLLLLMLISGEIRQSSGSGVVVLNLSNITQAGLPSNPYIVIESGHHIRDLG